MTGNELLLESSTFSENEYKAFIVQAVIDATKGDHKALNSLASIMKDACRISAAVIAAKESNQS